MFLQWYNSCRENRVQILTLYKNIITIHKTAFKKKKIHEKKNNDYKIVQ